MAAEDLGCFGSTFPIQEQDLLIVLKERLAKAWQDQEQKQAIQEAFIAAIQNPKGQNLPKAKALRSFHFDPSMTAHETITDHQGKIIVSKGTRINPLDQCSLSQELLFFDGDDPLQVAWAKTGKGAWILTKGKPFDLEKTEEKPVFFDQGGFLTKKLGIRSLPAKVSQEGKKLKVEEVPCF
jgi:conjugal transfer pilus assembly protein TraW